MFLDEIGEMSLPLQAKLLQVLQDGEFSRLGGKHDVHVDLRIIAATNRELERAATEGQFREDLFFCLNVVGITMPPLRERREEIPVLCDHFLKKYSVQYNKPCTGRSRQSSVDGRQPSADGRPSASMTATNPASIAAAATAAGNYSLKDISRTAVREAERKLIFKMFSDKALLYKIKENGLDKAS